MLHFTILAHSGHEADIEEWAITALRDRLIPAGRGSTQRTHLYTAFHEHVFSVIYDSEPMADIHALDHPYSGLVVELIDVAPGIDRSAAAAWLEMFAKAQSPAGIGQCICFVPRPFRPEMAEEMGWRGQDPTARICLLWFHRDGRELDNSFTLHAEAIAQGGFGSVVSIMPFIPTVPGTHKDLDA